jgi:hypothetical protein
LLEPLQHYCVLFSRITLRRTSFSHAPFFLNPHARSSSTPTPSPPGLKPPLQSLVEIEPVTAAAILLDHCRWVSLQHHQPKCALAHTTVHCDSHQPQGLFSSIAIHLACPFTRKPIISSYSRCKPFNLFAIGSDRMVVMIGHPVF